MTGSDPLQPASPARARSAARLAAVQALYQIEQTGAGVASVVREYLDHRLGEDSEIGPLAHAEEAHFAAVVEGVVLGQTRIDAQIHPRLAKGWRLERIDPILRAALRAGTFELLERADVPVAVVIDEYVGVVTAFLEETDAGFANGLLDRVSRETGAAKLRG